MGKSAIWVIAGLLLAALAGLSGMARSLGEAAPASPDPYGNLLRFHVVANSDTAEDQVVKRQVRDRVLELLTPTLSQARSPEEARQLVLARQDEVGRAAQDVVRRAGKNYGVKVEVGRFVFPTKVYGDKALPAGKYEALRISLGSAEGQNWWCVLFPPLCLVDAAGGVAVASPAAVENAESWLGSEQVDSLRGRAGDARLEVRYALAEWLKGHPLSPHFEAWLKDHGWIGPQAAPRPVDVP